MMSRTEHDEVWAALQSLEAKGLITRTLLSGGRELIALTARGRAAHVREEAWRRRCELIARRN